MVPRSGPSTSTVIRGVVPMLLLVRVTLSREVLGLLTVFRTAYVHSVMDTQNNLYLRCNARVSRVLFDANNKAVGVAYVPSRNRANNADVVETIVKARKMVVLSSGTLGTPQVSAHRTLGSWDEDPPCIPRQILERSGVGNAELLNKLNIPVVSDVPGVGEEYQDHYTTLSS